VEEKVGIPMFKKKIWHTLFRLKLFVSLLILAAGILKGYDALLNLVLDNAIEFLRDPEDPTKMTEDTRSLGLIVARGTAITGQRFTLHLFSLLESSIVFLLYVFSRLLVTIAILMPN
jgi:hypothetical protein